MNLQWVSKVPRNEFPTQQQRGARKTTLSLQTAIMPSTMPRIRNKPHHSPHKRIKIVYQFLSGVSAKAITAKFDVTPSAVYNIHYRYKQQ